MVLLGFKRQVSTFRHAGISDPLGSLAGAGYDDDDIIRGNDDTL